MATYTHFHELPVWQQASGYFQQVVQMVRESIANKDFRFRDQTFGSAGSVLDNIAEGFERGGNVEFTNFLSIAKGSVGEVRSQSFRGIDLGSFSEKKATELINEYCVLSGALTGLMD